MAFRTDMAGIDALISGMQAQWARQEILANNLANVSTAGFKRDDVALTPSSDGTMLAVPAGVSLTAIGNARIVEWTNHAPGLVRQTGRDLDVALRGRGFFVVETPAGPRYTRAGTFDVGKDGALVTTTGLRLVGDVTPLLLRPGPVAINPDGEIRQGEVSVGTLRIVDFADPRQLRKEGNGLFAAPPRVDPIPAKDVEVIGGAIEESNVNTVGTMVSMLDLLRNYESVQRALQAIDESNRQATNEIGKVV